MAPRTSPIRTIRIREKGGLTARPPTIGSALVNVMDKSDKPIFAGRKLTGFSNAEEDAVKKTKYVPFKLEDRVRNVPAFFFFFSIANNNERLDVCFCFCS
jgi:hypothetical protein